jgi:hypothetical protein
MPQGLDGFEDDRVAQWGVRNIELALTHHPLRQLTRIEFAVGHQMAHADISDLAFLKNHG